MPSHLLAGHAANLDFWADEVAHCLAVLDSYETRFERMTLVQQQRYHDETGQQAGLTGSFIPPRLITRPGRIAEQHRSYIRSELCKAFVGFATACHHRAQTEAVILHEVCARLSLGLPDVPNV